MVSTKNSNSVLEQLKVLKSLQSSGNETYAEGLFHSQRYHPFLPYQREDDNLFFTASIIHILQGVESQFSEDEKAVFNILNSCAKTSYPLFKNKDGLDTFNFWQTYPSKHFPNGLFMNRFKHFQIPDDVDDTALVYLTENAPKSRVQWLHSKLKLHANLAYKKAYNPQVKYRNLKCYSTFFGKRMYIEFDVCVLSNLMRLLLTNLEEGELDDYDLETLDFIVSIVQKKEFKTLPFYTAPNYPTTELILYHIARLIPVLPKSYKDKIEPTIKDFIISELNMAKGLNQLMLENAAMKLGLQVNLKEWKDDIINDTNFYFFHAGMITAFENAIAQKLASNSFFHLRYTSKALNRALLIENLVLKRVLTP